MTIKPYSAEELYRHHIGKYHEHWENYRERGAVSAEWHDDHRKGVDARNAAEYHYNKAIRHLADAEEYAHEHHRNTNQKIKDSDYPGNSPYIVKESLEESVLSPEEHKAKYRHHMDEYEGWESDGTYLNDTGKDPEYSYAKADHHLELAKDHAASHFKLTGTPIRERAKQYRKLHDPQHVSEAVVSHREIADHYDREVKRIEGLSATVASARYGGKNWHDAWKKHIELTKKKALQHRGLAMESNLLSRIRGILNEENLKGVDKEVLTTTHKILGHCLNSNTNYPVHGYGGEKYSSHILSGWSKGYVKELHKAIGQNLGLSQGNEKTPKSPGVVNYTRPKHQHALTSGAFNILNGIRAQHGSPYKFGYSEPSERMTDDEFSDHVDKLGKSFDRDIVYTKGADTDKKLARGGRYVK